MFRIKLEKALLSDKPSVEINKLRLTEIGKVLLLELNKLENLSQNTYHKYDALNHTFLVLDNSPKKLSIRYAALFHDIGKFKTKTDISGKVQFLGHENESAIIAKDILSELNYSNDFIEEVQNLVSNHMKLKYIGDTAKIKNNILFKFKKQHYEYFDDLLDLIHADNISHGTVHDMFNQIPNLRLKLKEIEEFKEEIKVKLPLNGNDIISIFKVSGKSIGLYLKALEEYYTSNPNLELEDYINYLKSLNINENKFILKYDNFINKK